MSRAPRKPRAARDALTEVFEGIGGVKSLTEWGTENPSQFYQLWVKMLPREQHIDFDVRDVSKLSDEELEERRRKLKLVR